MIDFIRFHVKNYHEDTVLSSFKKIRICIDEWHNEKGEPNYKWTHKNMQFKMFASGRFIIEGSLFKYAKGYNNTRFSFTEISKIIKTICKLLNVGLEDLAIYCIEFGVNIQLTRIPNDYFPCFVKYWGTHFKEMPRKKGYCGENGIVVNGQQYAIKIYNKTWESIYLGGLKASKVENNILRFEIRYKSSKVRALDYLNTASDLVLKETHYKLYNEFFKIFRRIKKNPLWDKTKFSEWDRRYFHVFFSDRYKTHIRELKNMKGSFLKDELKYANSFKKKLASLPSTRSYFIIGKLVHKEWIELINI